MARSIIRTKTTFTNEAGEEITRESEEARASIFDRATSIATTVGILIGLITAIGTVYNYKIQAEHDLSVRERESKKLFYEKQATLYFKAVDTVGKIANAKSPNKPDIDEFWLLYWGSLGTVEDNAVDEAMVAFGELLNRNAGRDCLQQASLLLSHCVKKSLEASWNVSLGAPPELPCERASFKEVSQCAR
jgi:hypothetical protein